MRGVHPFFEAPRPMVFAHRGGAALAPENTLAAFDRGLALGADGIELDLHRTRDGHLVVCHDPTVDRTTNGTGLIARQTLDDLRALDAGYRFTPDGGRTFPYRGQGVRIPTFEEVLTRHPDARISVELKLGDLASARQALEILRAREATGRVCVGAFDAPAVRWLRSRRAGVATWATRAEVVRFLRFDLVRLGGLAPLAADAFSVPERSGARAVVTARRVRTLARRGLPVHVWTVDEEAAMQRLLDGGVAGLVTDRPDVAVGVVRARASDRGPDGQGARQTSG